MTPTQPQRNDRVLIEAEVREPLDAEGDYGLVISDDRGLRGFAYVRAAEVRSLPAQVLDDVVAERARQDAKWGEQNHPDGTSPHGAPLMRLNAATPAYEPLALSCACFLAEAATKATNAAAARGDVTWSDILLEEVFEALAEDDPTKLRAELVQVAAVAAQWAEAIDRRAGGAA